MPYPEVFYIKTKTCENDYDFNSNNVMDVDRLTRYAFSKPYMRKSGQHIERKQKTLVFADWTMHSWPREKVRKVQQLVRQLEAEGFSLFILRKNDKKKLAAKILTEWANIFDPDYGLPPDSQYVIPVSPARIYDLMQQTRQCNPDEILILDWHWIKVLLGEIAADAPRTLDVVEIADFLATGKTIDKILPALKGTVPRLKTIIDSRDSFECHTIVDRLREDTAFSILSRHESQHLRFAGKYLENSRAVYLSKIRQFEFTLMKNESKENAARTPPLNGWLAVMANLQDFSLQAPNSTSITLSSPWVLHNLRNLKIKNILFAKHSFTCALQNANKLESLVVEHRTGESAYQDVFIDWLDQDCALPALKSLTIGAFLQTEELEHILAKSKNLTVLRLNHQSHRKISIDGLDLRGLKQLDLPYTRLSAETLDKFSGSLEFLSLRGITGRPSSKEMQALKVLSIGNMACKPGTISLEGLQALLSNAPNLESLTFCQCKFEGSFGSLNKRLHLKSLCLEKVSISAQNLQSILSSCAISELLHLNGAVIGDAFDMEPAGNPDLPEHWNFQYTSMPAPFFQYLLSQAGQKCRALTLQNAKIRNTPAIARFPAPHLQALEKLDLSGASLPAEILQTLLNVNTGANPRVLDLRLSSITEGTLNQKIRLQNLKSLVLPRDLSFENSMAILHSAVNIESLSGLGKLTDAIREVPELSRLKALGWYGALTTHNLEKLAGSATNLETLDLQWTSGLEAPITGLLYFPRLTKITFPGEILLQNIETILTNAPNTHYLHLKKTQINGDFSRPFHLPHLVRIKLPAKISASNLEKILANSPKIKSLDLSETQITQDFSKPLHLTGLTEIKLPAEFSAAHMEKMLGNSPNIIAMDLKSTNIIGDFSGPLHFPHIPVMRLRNIRAKNMGYLLANAVSLRGLHCMEIAGNLSETLHLPALTACSLAFMSISAESFSHILANAKNCRTLALMTTKIHGEIKEAIHLPNLESIVVVDTTMSARTLEHLLGSVDNCSLMY